MIYKFCKSQTVLRFYNTVFFIPLVQGDEIDAKSSLRHSLSLLLLQSISSY